jgi:Putative metal-binding motif
MPRRLLFPVAVAVALGCSSNKSTSYGPSDAGDEDLFLNCGHPDCDGDGYAVPADCNDNDALVNPEAFDFIDGIDNDCDGIVDDPVLTCETIPASSPGSPTDFARAADLCAQHSITNAGTVADPLVAAAWGQVQGLGPGETLWTSATKPVQVSIASSFGQNSPQQGKTMAGLANGIWANTDPRNDPALDPAGFHINDACADIPLMGQDCASLTNGTPSGTVNVQDWAELTLTVKIPSNVQTAVFDFAFFSSEFNQWWDSAANDAFFVLVTSKNFQGQNVAKDMNGLAVTVNSGFFQLCPVAPGPAGLQESAALEPCVGVNGDASQNVFGELAGTSYDGAIDGTNDTVQAVNGNTYIYGGGSGWLTAKFPVVPKETLEMRVIIADTFDGLKDSTALFDAVRWEAVSEPGGVSRPNQ